MINKHMELSAHGHKSCENMKALEDRAGDSISPMKQRKTDEDNNQPWGYWVLQYRLSFIHRIPSKCPRTIRGAWTGVTGSNRTMCASVSVTQLGPKHEARPQY